jgi:hypothetical protein
MVVAVLIAATVALPRPARADAIDGDWCSPDGRHVTIRGQTIRTPGGATIVGAYSRHAFSYVVPEHEPGGGGTVYMTLASETTVQVRDGTPTALPRLWTRCERVS